MSKLQTDFGVPEGLTAINVIKFDDWLQLTVFADHTITFAATNEAQLRNLAKMDAKDEIPLDVKQTVKVYQKLKEACSTWVDKIVPSTNEVARELRRHGEDRGVYYKTVDTIIQEAYPGETLARAKRLLAAAFKLNSMTDTRERLTEVIAGLKDEAGQRETQAKAAEAQMITFKEDLSACSKILQDQAEGYKSHYGDESAEVIRLKGEVKRLNDAITPLRKKEGEEVLVLETAPLWLLFPWPFGGIILAGILAGVGADLGVIRKKISDLVGELTTASNSLMRDAAFLGYHNWAKDETAKSVNDVDKTLTSLRSVSLAWAGITSDLTKLHGTLLDKAGTDVAAGAFDSLEIDFSKAAAEWKHVAAEADGWLANQIAPAAGTRDLDKAMGGIVKRAA